MTVVLATSLQYCPHLNAVTELPCEMQKS